MTTVSGNYTIQKGDSLWNIVKNNYKTADGEQLTNTQIANTIKQIAKDNNIEDANLIFAGAELTLSEFDGFELQIEIEEETEETEETKEAKTTEGTENTEETGTETYNKFAEWSAENTRDFYTVGLLPQDEQQEAFNVIEAQTFSFGTNDSEEEYEKGLTEITAGQLAKYETDGLYGISLEEFLKGNILENNELNPDAQVNIDDNVITAWAKTYELAPGESEIDENEAPETAALKEMTNTFNFFDFNENGTLEADEMKLYYTVLDTTDGTKDGTIEYKSYVGWQDTFTTPSADRTELKEGLKEKFYEKYGKSA